MRSIRACKNDVRLILDDRDLLEGISEEADELGKAALKLIRARGLSNNWTPVTIAEAQRNLIEEITDILAYMYVLEIPIPQLDEEKFNRWAYRLINKCKENCPEDYL